MFQLTATFSSIWWWWLLAIFVSWLALELGAIVYAHAKGEKNIQTWTLSDTIRRWSSRYRWLAPVVVGSCAFLLYHFFGISNT